MTIQPISLARDLLFNPATYSQAFTFVILCILRVIPAFRWESVPMCRYTGHPVLVSYLGPNLVQVRSIRQPTEFREFHLLNAFFPTTTAKDLVSLETAAAPMELYLGAIQDTPTEQSPLHHPGTFAERCGTYRPFAIQGQRIKDNER